ncbi:MAG: alkyl hydroperoxide reductase [Ideonella sp. MAG2]|nr:MAG: alkyl hydroperoxide reductase [Ideonella sp. MAG2]
MPQSFTSFAKAMPTFFRASSETLLSRRVWAQACAAWACGTASLQPSWAAASAPPSHMVWPQRLELLDMPPMGAQSFQTMPTVLVFFSIACPYCRRHNQRLNKLALQNSGRLRVLGAASDTDTGALRHYRDSQGLAFPIAAGAHALREQVTPRRVIPFTAVIARDGKFNERIPGEMTEEDILGLARWASTGDQQ